MKTNVLLNDYVGRMVDVYGDNAVIASCFAIASQFRDVIIHATNTFPILYLHGRQGCGKTELGRSLLSFCSEVHTPLDLQQLTNSELDHHVGRVSNGIIVLDNYTNILDDDKIEFLKGIGDGTGRDRTNMERDKKREMTRVDSGIVLCGQEMPTADIALFSRMILLTLCVTTQTKEEGDRFKELKRIESNGFTHLTNQILAYRHKVELDFGSSRDRATADLLQHLGGCPVKDRTLLNWVTPIAVFLCLESELHLPFSYHDVLRIAAAGIVEQKSVKHKNPI